MAASRCASNKASGCRPQGQHQL